MSYTSIQARPGSGADPALAMDLISGVNFPRGKLCLGDVGAATDWGIGQQTMAASAPVVLASDQTQFDLSGNFEVAILSVSNTAFKVGTGAGGTSATGRRRIWIRNTSGQLIYILKANTVTTANGFSLAINGLYSFSMKDTVQIWAIAASTSGTIMVLEEI